ncbi:amino acid ABC transporter permease [Shuttleworthella satelles]|uniref:ABC transporter, permease protein n=1 Tax=Shuttleworthella satelles DSM 14600 TaxID=626523 RepID=C4GCH5_9FIRM|nr:amino acid ABC transporter permease [Shuttleworthia satelles]EEP27676.1 ABC transporter, permease protein [Shuttleworthia satelles DSM 14600]
MSAWWDGLKAQFVLNFINDNRWQSLVSGLGVTLQITVFAVIVGILLGALVATVRSTWDKSGEEMGRRKSPAYYLLKGFNVICKIYLTVIRGTPVVVQLMISYFIIFATSKNAVAVAIFAFGLNSAAYVAEIIRGGIMSIDEGQFEAGRSLGFNYPQTMIYIILPQVFKAVLPALLNEFITLVKETSVAGYVGIMDLTKAGDVIRSRTYSAFMPLFAVAGIYLVIVIILETVFGRLERRLRQNER